MGHDNQYKLSREIIKLSQSKDWIQAKLEWSLHNVWESSEPQECICGHFPIIEICEIKNKLNGNIAEVGNSCVKKFMGLPSNSVFRALKRVRKDISKSLNKEAIELVFHKKLINDWERAVYLNIMRKRKLSEKQVQVKREVNQITLNFFQKTYA